MPFSGGESFFFNQLTQFLLCFFYKLRSIQLQIEVPEGKNNSSGVGRCANHSFRGSYPKKLELTIIVFGEVSKLVLFTI